MPSPLLLSLLFGLPALTLAFAVLYHARLSLLRRPSRPTEAIDEGEPAAVVVDLQRSIDELQAQLSRQGETLSRLLRGPVPSPLDPPSGDEPTKGHGGDLPAAVHRLTAEGLSDRAIARRLRIGLEEVRLLSQRRSVREASAPRPTLDARKPHGELVA